MWRHAFEYLVRRDDEFEAEEGEEETAIDVTCLFKRFVNTLFV